MTVTTIPQQKPQALAVPKSDPLQFATISDVMRFAEMIQRADGCIPKQYIGNPGKIVATVMAGHELGVGPMAALRAFHVVEGKPTADYSFWIARLKAAGYRVEWPERTAERVTLKLTAPDGSQHLETWDKTRAITAGLWNGKDNWKKYPQTMLSARCVTSAGRVFAGEVMFGCYEADEADEIMREAVVSEVRSAPQGETVTQRIAEAAGVEVPPESVASESKAKACADMAKSLGMTRADLSAVLTELGIEHDPKFRIVELGADAIELLFERLDAEALKREEKPEDSQP